ncbi:MAG TPA: adenylate/guanylate cyclase domain-containing protein, partial [Gaiellaceae bacterium]
MSLTFLFSDIEDSTGLLGRLGDGYPEVLAKARELTRGAVADAGGREVECRGDEIFCVFERSEAAADAALAIQRAFTAHRWPAGEHVRVRIGMHTGVAEAADDGYVGLDVHRAARICQAAHGGQVLASADAAEPLGPLAKDIGEFDFRGLRRPERIFQLVADGLASEFPPLRNVRQHDHAPRAVIADDSALLREGLARLLEESGIEVVGQAREALAEHRRVVGDHRARGVVVLADVAERRELGREAVRDQLEDPLRAAEAP